MVVTLSLEKLRAYIWTAACTISDDMDTSSVAFHEKDARGISQWSMYANKMRKMAP